MKSIAIFDYRLVPNNPIGGCHRRMLAALSRDYDFTVFAVDFDNPAPDRIDFQRIWAPRRPLALLFVVYHLIAPLAFLLHRWRKRKKFDYIQTVESNLSFGNIAHTQFCHRAFLKLRDLPNRSGALRRWFRWLDHRFHAAMEPWIYRQVSKVVVPSKGTAVELEREYPILRGKVQVIYNPVDLDRMRRPETFDVSALREAEGWSMSDIVLAFAALGHFERKGLPILLDACRQLRDPRLKLFVIGGAPDLIADYRARIEAHGLADCVTFTGHRKDIRPYLWSADAFAFPSFYEGFPLVALEAAAAGLPLVAPRQLNGLEELIRDGENGFVIARDTESVAAALERVIRLGRMGLRTLGAQATKDVQRYAAEGYAPCWRRLYEAL